MNRLLVICGPTSTGKTELGFYLARKLNGEIVSADSRQVYKGIDIITGKDLPQSRIPLWLVDIVEPDYLFNVGEYAPLAYKVIKDMWNRGKLPIVVGGTGLYIRSIVDNIETIIIPPNKLLRGKLEKYTKEKLQEELINTDRQRWEKMNFSDRQNPRRLIRAIELSLYYQKNKESMNRILNPLKIDSLLMIGLRSASRFIYKKIDKRVEMRIKKGAIEEVKKLLSKNYSKFLPSLSFTGFRPLCDFIQGKVSLEEAIETWKFQEHDYARRQLIWFNKEKRIRWFDISEKIYRKKIEETVKVWYTADSNANENRDIL